MDPLVLTLFAWATFLLAAVIHRAVSSLQWPQAVRIRERGQGVSTSTVGSEVSVPAQTTPEPEPEQQGSEREQGNGVGRSEGVIVKTAEAGEDEQDEQEEKDLESDGPSADERLEACLKACTLPSGEFPPVFFQNFLWEGTQRWH